MLNMATEYLERAEVLDGKDHYIVRNQDNKHAERCETAKDVLDYLRLCDTGKYRLEAKKSDGKIVKGGTKIITIAGFTATTNGATELAAHIRERELLTSIVNSQRQTNLELHKLLVATNDKLMETNRSLHEQSTDAQVAAAQALSEQPSGVDLTEIATIAATFMGAKKSEANGNSLTRLKADFDALDVATRLALFTQLKQALGAIE